METYEQLYAHPLIQRYSALEKKFGKSCSQVVLMNNQITDLKTRLIRAEREGRRAFAYPLRMRIITIERVRDMFYEYSARRAQDIHSMQEQLVDEGLMAAEYVPREEARSYEDMRRGRGLPQ